MSFTTCKPTPAALRRRVAKMVAIAANLEDLATRWNPKGRHFVTRRELVSTSKEVRQVFGRALVQLRGR